MSYKHSNIIRLYENGDFSFSPMDLIWTQNLMAGHKQTHDKSGAFFQVPYIKEK